LILTAWILMALRTRRDLPLVSFGLAWFVVAILPVSNLLFATGVLLAERTLYLPSLALSLVVAGFTDRALALRSRRIVLVLTFTVAVALLVRTMLRNPAWMSSFVVQSVLNEEHPESWRAIRARAQGLERVGDMEEAGSAWDLAVRLAPLNYTLLVQAGDFNCRHGTWERCESYLRRAIDLAPEYRNAYQLLAGAMIRRGFGREGHRIALTGLARSQNDRELWALVSESYILKGDLPAAVRAREAAIAADSSAGYQWARLAEILGALGEEERAARARTVADSLGPETLGEGVR
jgi:tetratricopeptide (TPR) repeat protein